MGWFSSIAGAVSSFASSAMGAVKATVSSIGSTINSAVSMASGKLGAAFGPLQASFDLGRGLGVSLQVAIGGALPKAWQTAINFMANPFGTALSMAGSLMGNLNASLTGALGPLVAKASFNLAIPSGAGLGFGANLNLGPISLSLNNSAGNKLTVSTAINAQTLLGQTIPTSVSLRSVGGQMTMGVNLGTAMINGKYIGGSTSLSLGGLQASASIGSTGGASGAVTMSMPNLKIPADPTYPNNWIDPNTGQAVTPPSNGLRDLVSADGTVTTTPNASNPKAKQTTQFDPSQPVGFSDAYNQGYTAAGFTPAMQASADVGDHTGY